MIFDSHCHFNDEQLINNIDEIIKDANSVGVTHFLVIGWDKKSSFNAVKIAEKYENVYAAVGFHPCNVQNVTETDFYETLNLVKNNKVVAVGEIGLDYYWEKDPKEKEKQKKYFIKQIKFANDHGKPIVIHNRDAFSDLMEILKANKPKFSGVIHCYSGSAESLNDVFNLGLLIGLDGPVTFLNSKTPKEVAKVVPYEKLLIETDSPYLSPHPLRGTMNTPKNLPLILEQIANIKGVSSEQIANITFKNTCKLFGIENEKFC